MESQSKNADQVLVPADSETESLRQSVQYSERAWQQLGLRLRSITPRRLMQFVIVLAVIVAVLWFVVNAWSSLLPFVIGLVLVYLMLPLVTVLEKWLPRWLAIVLVIVGGLGLIIGAIALVVPPVITQLLQLVQTISDAEWVSRQIARVESLYASLDPGVQTFISDTIRQVTDSVQANLGDYSQTIITFLGTSILSIIGTLSFLVGFAVLPIWLFFTLNDYDLGPRWINRTLPPAFQPDFWAVVRICDRAFSSYLGAQLFLGLVIAVVTFIGLTILNLLGFDIRYVLLLAIFAGITELIPYIGPYIGMIPAIIVALLAPDNPVQGALAVLVLYFIIQNVEGNVLVPKITGETLNIHPAILTPIMIGMATFGFIWVILTPPLFAVMRDLIKYVYGRFATPPRPAGLLPNADDSQHDPTPAAAS